MPTTRARSVRRAAAKRTILSALDENKPSNDTRIPTTSKMMNGDVGFPQQRPFEIPKEFDSTNSESIKVLLEDIEKEVKRLQESVAIKCCEAIKKQHETYFLKTMKIEKSVKKMTVREFNEKYMKNNVRNNDEMQKTDIIALMKSVMIESNSNQGNYAVSTMGKKRFRDDMPGMNTAMNLETPARPLRVGNMRTPGTILRTAKRGETLM